jgi:hypothetical protein
VQDVFDRVFHGLRVEIDRERILMRGQSDHEMIAVQHNGMDGFESFGDSHRKRQFDEHTLAHFAPNPVKVDGGAIWSCRSGRQRGIRHRIGKPNTRRL